MSSCTTEGIHLERFGFRLRDVSGEREQGILRDVDLQLSPGECGLVTGPTGCGKSTLLRAIAGVPAGGGRASGRLRVGGRVALLLQNVETQLLFTLVREEVASGLPRPGMRRDERVRELLARVGLPGAEGRSVDALSAGEQQRVALAALLGRDPAVLLLDEPTSALDASGRRHLAALLEDLKRAGHCILVADHVTAPFQDVADRHFRMKEGALFECGLPAGDGLVPPPPPPAPSPAAALCVHCEALEVRSVDGRALLEALSLSLREGERVLVAGPNGAGKSTLLRAIAGLVPPSGGRLRVEAGAHRAKPGAVALLFQHPQRNLFERCVADEVAFTLRRRGWDSAACERRVGEVLSLCALGPLRGRSPLRLSFGEQHRVALAAVLAAEPGLLLLDEPFSGLDPETRQRMLEVVAREQQRTGMAVLVASHDRHPLEGWVHRCIELVPGNAADA